MNIKNIIITVLIVVTIAAAVGLFIQKNTAVSDRLVAEDILTNERLAKKRSEEKFAFTQKDVDGILRNHDQLKKEAQSLEAEIIKSRRDVDSVKIQMVDLDKKAQTTSQKISQFKSNIEELKVRIANVVRDKLRLSEDFELIDKTTIALKKKVMKYEKEEEAHKRPGVAEPRQEPLEIKTTEITTEPEEEVKVEPTLPTRPALEGEVLTVNREFGFIVISLGKNAGVQEGMVFDVSRDNENLGKVKVETVRENISAAALTSDTIMSRMRPGDIVYY
ncbi:hypothetical protein ACFL0T_05610 [Candidatus Omnitrophota bacterium]